MVGLWFEISRCGWDQVTQTASKAPTRLRHDSHNSNHWLVVSTPLKNISQLGWFFPIYGKKKCSKPPTRYCNRWFSHTPLRGRKALINHHYPWLGNIFTKPCFRQACKLPSPQRAHATRNVTPRWESGRTVASAKKIETPISLCWCYIIYIYIYICVSTYIYIYIYIIYIHIYYIYIYIIYIYIHIYIHVCNMYMSLYVFYIFSSWETLKKQKFPLCREI